ncbi:MAG: glutamate--tRNA ligase [Candidatus Pacearchaeota archaeon]
MVDISNEVIKVYALENALRYKGKANPSSVLSGLFAEGLEKSEIKNYMPKINEIIKEINSLSIDEQKKQLEKSTHKISKREVREGLPELPNAEKGKVVMRMAPFPSGPLHIGNARTLILNDEYVKMYDGKLLLVMDDTIGSVEKPIEPEAYKLIEEGIKFLNVNYDKIIYKSDRIEKYYDYAKELIKKGYMYVCDCNQKEMQELRAKGVECSCRQFSPQEQIERWEKMFKAPAGSMSVRIKTSMQDPDPAFRDRVMLKISDRVHPRTKNKYRIYPSMEFSWAIDDFIFGTTHVLRGIEHQMSTRIQDFIRNIFGWKNPESIYNGHLGIEGTKLSKSKSSKEVHSGEYIGWNDPRTWSIQSLRDRGIRPEAIRQFIVNAGINKSNVKIPIEVLYALNRKFLEDVPRYFFVENPQEIKISGCPELTANIPLHPSKEKGFRRYKTSQKFLISNNDLEMMQDGNYRLMHLLTFKSEWILTLKRRENSFISEEPINDMKTKFLQWLPSNQENIQTEIFMPDGSWTKGLSEPETKKLKVGDVIQFERFGFVRLHKKDKDRLEFWFTHF